MTTTAGHSFYIGPIGFFYNQVNDTGSWEPLGFFKRMPTANGYEQFSSMWCEDSSFHKWCPPGLIGLYPKDPKIILLAIEMLLNIKFLGTIYGNTIVNGIRCHCNMYYIKTYWDTFFVDIGGIVDQF